MLRRSTSFSLSFALPAALLLAASSVACGGTVSSAEAAPVTVDTAVSRAPVAQPTHGVVKTIAEALADVPLTAAQHAQIEKLATDAEARHAAARAARHDLVLALAAQVEAGAIDRGALQPKIDALVAALRQVQPADRAAFEQLHALLGPDQRTAFVDALEARIGERFSQAHERHPMARWAADLQLTDAQKEQIRGLVRAQWQSFAQGDHGAPPWAEAKHQGKALMAAFKQDRFVMDEVAPPKDVAAHAQSMSDRFLAIAQAALPILTPSQRAVAAQKLRDHADSDEPAPGMP